MTKFYLDAHPSKQGECAIRVSTTVQGQRLLTSIGYSILPKLWDTSGMRVKPGTKSNPTYNSKSIAASVINARISKIQSAFDELDAQKPQPGIEAYRLKLNVIIGKNRPGEDKSDLYKGLEMFIAQRSQLEQWADNTRTNWNSFARYLKAFDEHLSYSYFDTAGLQAFLTYLRTSASSSVYRLTNAPKYKVLKEKEAQLDWNGRKTLEQMDKMLHSTEPQGLSESSVKMEMRRLSAFLRWSVDQGLTEDMAVFKFKPKYKLTDKPVIFLTHEELLALYNADLSGEAPGITTAELVRDMFCFCAFTSLRYSDMQALRWDQVKADSICLTTQKTSKALEIPLNDYSRQILERYREEGKSTGKVFPYYHVSSMNDCLKRICKDLGYNELITKVYYKGLQRIEDTREKWEWISSHAARRTFICYALSQGIPPQIVMKFTGHSEYSAMKPYIDVTAADKVKAMEIFNKRPEEHERD